MTKAAEAPQLMNRSDRIAVAKARVAELEPDYLRVRNEYEDAVGAVKRAEASFDVGERVHVEKTCRRGCCVELEYDGVVESADTLTYSVRRDADGWLFENVWHNDMKRRPAR